jgi:hypothetical protein
MAEQNVTTEEVLLDVKIDENKVSYWQAIFSQSKANGSAYRGEDLPHMKWQWPRDTWFQEQLISKLSNLPPITRRTKHTRN